MMISHSHGVLIQIFLSFTSKPMRFTKTYQKKQKEGLILQVIKLKDLSQQAMKWFVYFMKYKLSKKTIKQFVGLHPKIYPNKKEHDELVNRQKESLNV